MIDFGVIFERVPLICDNTNVIYVAKNPVFHKRMSRLERRHHFLRDHIEKGDIEMRYIDTDRQLTDILTESLNSSRFAALWVGGGLVFAIFMTWFKGELVFYLVYLCLLFFYCISFILT
jgi:hypothetical protein